MVDNIAILNNRGVLTLPEDVTDALNLHTGSCLEVTIDNGKVMLKPLPREEEEAMLTRLARSRSGSDEIIRERREDDVISRLKFG